jgi:hypothetical protein
MTDRIYRFIPAEEKWVVYPVPLSGSYSRDMTFMADGQVCLSNNPIPPPALEGGVLEIVCIDPSYDPEVTTEGIIEVQHAVTPEFVVSANYTYRNTTDVQWTRPLIDTGGGNIRPTVRTDYISNGTVGVPFPDGSSNDQEVFKIDPAIGSYTGGNLLTNSDREINYNGIGINFIKRLSNQWMARGFVQFGEGEWDVPASHIAQDNPTPSAFGSDIDGTLYGTGSGTGSGAKGNVFTQSSWSWNLNGMYQFAPDRPYGFNIAANLYGREGYPIPYFWRYSARDGTSTQGVGMMGRDIDKFRNDDIFTTDLRLEKEFSASGNVGFTFSIDIFNVFNETYELQRNRRQNSGEYDWLRETLSPRIWRLGVRLNWR